MANTREKLIELLGADTCKHDTCEDCEYGGNRDACIAFIKESMADHLIANGVTIGSPLGHFLHPEDDYSGLKPKYLVFKANNGEKVEECFVLRPDKDPAAVEALRAYANATDNEILAKDIYNWVGKGNSGQKHAYWIKDSEGVVVCSNCGEEHGWEDYRASFCEDCGAMMDLPEQTRENEP